MQAPRMGWAWSVQVLCDLWRVAPPRLLPGAHALDLPLRPSPRLRRVRFLLRILALACVVELLVQRHWLAAALIATASACRWSSAGPALRCLRLEADGRIFLTLADGRVAEAWLAPGGVRIGSHVVLVLRSFAGTRRLLFGPDNLGEMELAGLGRRLSGGTASAGSGLHSVTAHGSKLSVPP